MARALLIAQDRTIRRWEQDEQTISGPAWVAVEMMLRGRGEVALAERAAQVIEERRRKRQTEPRTERGWDEPAG